MNANNDTVWMSDVFLATGCTEPEHIFEISTILVVNFLNLTTTKEFSSCHAYFKIDPVIF